MKNLPHSTKEYEIDADIELCGSLGGFPSDMEHMLKKWTGESKGSKVAMVGILDMEYAMRCHDIVMLECTV